MSKKLLSVVMTMLLTLVTTNVLAIESGKYYTLKASGSDVYLTTDTKSSTGDAAITYIFGSEPQKFKIVGDNTNGWSIRSIKTGKKLGVSQWNAIDADYKWNITLVSGDTYKINLQGQTNKGLGWDNTTAGEGVYTDKVDKTWVLEEVTATTEMQTVTTDVTDVIQASDLVATNQYTYKEFTNVTKSSGAKYAGNTAKNSSNIQMRSQNNDSGIVVMTSGGKIKEVILTWASSNTAGRIVDVYAKSSAYTAASNLFSSSTQGTKVGSSTYSSSNLTQKITVSSGTSSYTHVGIRSNSEALYLSKVEFVWEQEEQVEIETEPYVEPVMSEFSNNKVYAIKNMQTGAYLMSQASKLWTNTKAGETYDKKQGRFQWLVYYTTDGYLLYNLGADGVANDTNGGSGVSNHWTLVSRTTPSYIVATTDGTSFAFHDRDYTSGNMWLHNNESYDTGITNWTEASNPSRWVLEEVLEVPEANAGSRVRRELCMAR